MTSEPEVSKTRGKSSIVSGNGKVHGYVYGDVVRSFKISRIVAKQERRSAKTVLSHSEICRSLLTILCYPVSFAIQLVTLSILTAGGCQRLGDLGIEIHPPSAIPQTIPLPWTMQQ
jgi:hypothetical protein